MEKRDGMGAGFLVDREHQGLTAEPRPRRRFTVVDRAVAPLRADYYEGFQAMAKVELEGGVVQDGHGVGSSAREAYKDALKDALNTRQF